jgi:hypothetical protein
LVEWAAQKVQDEAGHDQLALLDIESMGYDAQLVVQVLVPSAVKVLVDYFTQTVQAPDPKEDYISDEELQDILKPLELPLNKHRQQGKEVFVSIVANV